MFAVAVVADVGCGNGKYYGVRRDLAVLGSDRSEGA
jgi:alkylated DNA repair protein alkB family protein 8